ncbi:efflux transporter outer membrane subunit [Paraburkholderia sp. J76]|uniref:efflux transporter outer membrane subunit n=1 Tax=Paraburkholderia sp. J76 TaxID=2805439 RepID=UPI002ABDF3F7|nr:efflux transporter outer membrane subunit [Paraburkholderia sp. J76]
MKKPLSFTLMLGLAGCMSAPPPPDAAIASPATYRYAANGAAGADDTSDWWRSFGSDELDNLVARASTGNYDVAAALARVQQARANARIAGAALYPNVEGFADASREAGFSINDTLPSGNAFDLGVAASYELDLWGRNRALRDAARANARASGFDRATVTITITADVANTWLQSVALREREHIAEANLQTARRLLAVVESQWRAGFAGPLDVAQQRTLLAAQQRQLAQLRQQSNDSEAALALLSGVPASGFDIATRTLAGVRAPAIDAGLPSTLLARRPDVAANEARLAAAHADVAAARAAMLPSLTLTAYAGTGSDRAVRIFDNPLYSVAAALTAPIFNAGSLAAGRDLALAQQEEMLAAYRQSIVAAFTDVERALNATAGVDAQSAAQDNELREARRTLHLAESRYGAGAATSLDVLDAQRTLYAAEDEHVQLHLARLQAAVSLYRALGGGWRNSEVSAARAGPDS